MSFVACDEILVTSHFLVVMKYLWHVISYSSHLICYLPFQIQFMKSHLRHPIRDLCNAISEAPCSLTRTYALTYLHTYFYIGMFHMHMPSLLHMPSCCISVASLVHMPSLIHTHSLRSSHTHLTYTILHIHARMKHDLQGLAPCAHTATHCNTLQHTATHCKKYCNTL